MSLSRALVVVEMYVVRLGLSLFLTNGRLAYGHRNIPPSSRRLRSAQPFLRLEARLRLVHLRKSVLFISPICLC